MPRKKLSGFHTYRTRRRKRRNLKEYNNIKPPGLTEEQLLRLQVAPDEVEKELGIKPRYIYGIRDPLTDKFFWVAYSLKPWEAIYNLFRHAGRSTRNKALVKRVTEINEAFPYGYEILTRIVIDAYLSKIHNLPPPVFPSLHPYRKRIVWEVFAVTAPAVAYKVLENDSVRIEFNPVWTFTYWTELLRKQGHPLLNIHI